jgi:NodT family efflux transporter outer membrane factor (OMF) lipoprotein
MKASAPANGTRAVIRGTCLFAVALLSAAGCAVGPDFVRPKPPAVDRYTHGEEPTKTISAEDQAQRFESGGKVAPEWWRFFNSEKLDVLIDQAVTENPDLQAAQARLRQSQNILLAGYGVFYPQVDADLGAGRQKFSPVRFGSSTSSSIFNLYTLEATVGYSLDLFGGNRRAVESLKAQVDFQRDTVLATHLALSGNIVNAVIAQAAYRAQIKATEEIIGLLKEQIRITEVQAQAGTVPYLNVLSLQTQQAATEATLPLLEQKLSQTEHLLATLLGRAPAESDPVQIELADLTLPDHLPITLPSELVRQRPDILAAEALLHSASADIGVATAALFPSFTLNGGYGLNSNSTSDLFKSTSGFWSLGANIMAPLFHGGTLWFGRKAAMDAYQQSLANYRQSVLSAFAQVADTLRALEHDAQTVQAEAKALEASEHVLRIVKANYEAGVAGYLQILVANDQYHQARIAYLQAHAQRLQDTVALFIALGGGWWNAQKVSSDK